MTYGIIYKTTNLINDKIYIGQTTRLENDYIKTFHTAKEIAVHYGVTNGFNITACCRGKQRTAHGHKWEYSVKS